MCEDAAGLRPVRAGRGPRALRRHAAGRVGVRGVPRCRPWPSGCAGWPRHRTEARALGRSASEWALASATCGRGPGGARRDGALHAAAAAPAAPEADAVGARSAPARRRPSTRRRSRLRSPACASCAGRRTRRRSGSCTCSTRTTRCSDADLATRVLEARSTGRAGRRSPSTPSRSAHPRVGARRRRVGRDPAAAAAAVRDAVARQAGRAHPARLSDLVPAPEARGAGASIGAFGPLTGAQGMSSCCAALLRRRRDPGLLLFGPSATAARRARTRRRPASRACAELDSCGCEGPPATAGRRSGRPRLLVRRGSIVSAARAPCGRRWPSACRC